MRHSDSGRMDFNPQKNHQKFGDFISQAILHWFFSNATWSPWSCMCILNGSYGSFLLHLYNYCVSNCAGENVKKTHQCTFVIQKSISWWEGRIPEDKTDSLSGSHTDLPPLPGQGAVKLLHKVTGETRNICQENEFQISAAAFCPCQAVPWEGWKLLLGVELV